MQTVPSIKHPVVTPIPFTRFVVAPLNAFSPADVQSSALSIDHWLQQIHPSLSLQALAQVAGVVPVIGNIIALVDTVESIISLVDKENPEVLDWVDLCINLIGVVPMPPNLAAARMSLRPMVMSARNAVQSGKSTLSVAMQEILSANLNEHLAGELEKFADGALNNLEPLINNCSGYSLNISKDFAGALTSIANGKLISKEARASANKDTKTAFNKVTTAHFIRDPEKTISNFFSALGSAARSVGMDVAQAGLATLLASLNEEAKQFLRNMAQKILTIGAKAAKAIKANAKTYIQKFLNLLKTLLTKKAKSGASKPNTTTQIKKTSAAVTAEGKTKVKDPIKNPNPCNCGGATSSKKSISFSMGTEFITHVDAEINAAKAIVHLRSYASNLNYYDKSEFGARWLTPWTSKIFVEGNEFRYIDETGRIIHLPMLSKETTYFSVSENLYITHLDTSVVIEYKNKEQYLFEKYEDHYLLKAISKPDQTQILIQHNEGVLQKISFYNNDKLDFDIDCLINSHRKIEQMLLNKNDKTEVIASYVYDTLGDLVEATNWDQAKYHYQYHKHLITRYTDLTNRAINLEWDSEEYTAKAIHEWADDGSQEIFLHWVKDKRCTVVIDGEQNATQYHYDINGYNYRVVYPDGLDEWFVRDQNSKVTQYFTTTGEVFIYRYSDQGELLETINPDGSSTKYEYKEGNPAYAPT